MDPHDYLKALRKRWLVITILGLVGAGVGYVYANSLPDVYQSTSAVFVSSTQGDTTSELVQGSTYTQNLVQSYAALATTPKVLAPVITELGLTTTPTQLAKQISANTPLNTVLIEITVTDASPQKAAAIANSVSESLTTTATALSPVSTGAKSSIAMSVVTPAQVSANPVAPNRRLIQLSGLVVGLAIGVLYALGRTLFDTRIRTDRDIERITEIPVIGNVERRRRGSAQPTGVTMRLAPHSLMAEDYRRVRTNLEFADVDNAIRSITVTSAVPGEGKTTMSLNIALAMAERSLRVLIVDADLRRPSIATYAQIEGAAGLTSVLVGSALLEEVIQPWAPNVDILPSGVVPPNPNQLLGSTAMARLVQSVKSTYDFVIIDTPPLLPASDALTLTHMTDGAVLVTLYNSTTRQKLSDALAALAAVRARTIGIVLNQTRPKALTGYYGRESSAAAADARAGAEAAGARASQGVTDGGADESPLADAGTARRGRVPDAGPPVTEPEPSATVHRTRALLRPTP
ncbi:polysaccharide biosynthesis tyrosine autokinase [Subtercola lobariae]|uniref:non-specific protein-tyrosine kinase n=1 Tax=Subtercola lobariae TaxID=1588641 RepID=A0A917AZZ6_9MICO|nr:polysaccharide biosynthesis tyrosine autokinase [Subtercola lobariae]GGF13888.1 chromosome partitioning protein [Subtercola lobariae]